MKKFTVVLTSLALMAGVAASAVAQRADTTGRMGGRGMGPAGGGMQAMMGRQMFRGITLTDAQQAQLDKMRDGHRAQMQTFAKSAQADRQALRTARQNGDTVALKAARRNIEGAMNTRIALRAQMQKNMRSVLTPGQQKVFDANRTRVERRVARAGRMMRAERMGMRRHAMMRAFGHDRGWGMQRGGGFGPGAGMHMRPGRGGGFGPGAGMHMRPGRGGFGPGAGMGMHRGPGGPPPDSTGTGGN